LKKSPSPGDCFEAGETTREYGNILKFLGLRGSWA